MSLQLYQEPVTPTGGQKSEGVQNLLGRPPLNWITVVLREAVQNSWDARQGGGPVDFQIRWWRPDKQQKSALRDRVFTNEPSAAPIRQAISGVGFDVMVFSDRGTRGLSGPVLANEEAPLGEKRNFVDFVWEIGRAEGAGPGGGTYGFGKTSLFRLSRVMTVVIHSRCKWQGRLEERFIAAYLGPSSPKLTGRSWWGEVDRGVIRPVTGLAAAELAAAIGMPSFEGDDCGTSIMMLAPRMEDLSREDENALGSPGHQQVLRTLGESLIQWFWPKMIAVNGDLPAMRFRIFHDGKESPMPDPESIPPFNVYVEALRVLASWRKDGNIPTHAQVCRIECGRPRALLGHLVLVKRARRNRNPDSGEFGESSARELFNQSHHVVLLRKPMLVVKYLKGSRPPSAQMDYAGVFVVDHSQLGGDVEKAFALSEPPTHDDWVPETLEERQHKTFVRVALRRIRESFSEFAAPQSAAGGAETQQALGAFSELLGDLLAGNSQGTGARVQPLSPLGKGGGGNSAAKKSRVELEGPAKMVRLDGMLCLSVPFRVLPASGAVSIRIRAQAVVLLDQGTEKDPPKAASVPRVHSFCRLQNGGEEVFAGTGSELTVPLAKAASLWQVRVIVPDETRVRVDLNVVN